MRLRTGVESHLGLVRQTNEDSYLVRRGLYAVCDGMGGARAGEVASEMACDGLLGIDPKTADVDQLRAAIGDINLAIARRSLSEEHMLGMGTTLTSVLARDGRLLVGHVGDSRAYLLQRGELRQITEDHSWVGEMVRRGELTPAEAAVHPHRSVITRALGTDGELEPDVFDLEVEPGDRLLICSDGLSGMVSDVEIGSILARNDDAQAVAGLLVQAALAGGGEDNVTVVVVDILPPGDDAVEDEAAKDEDSAFERGPADRGLIERGRMVRGRIPGAGMRERLERRVGPLRRSAGEDQSDMPEPVQARSWTRRKWIALVAAVVAVIAAAIIGFAIFNSTVYYVGVFDGSVALYHGLPGSVLGIELSSVIEQGNTPYESLAPYLKSRIDSHDLVSREEGELFLRSLSAQP